MLGIKLLVYFGSCAKKVLWEERKGLGSVSEPLHALGDSNVWKLRVGGEGRGRRGGYGDPGSCYSTIRGLGGGSGGGGCGGAVKRALGEG